MDPEDRALEEKHVEDALKTCQYPQMGKGQGGKTSQEEGDRTEEDKETHTTTVTTPLLSSDSTVHQRGH